MNLRRILPIALGFLFLNNYLNASMVKTKNQEKHETKNRTDYFGKNKASVLGLGIASNDEGTYTNTRLGINLLTFFNYKSNFSWGGFIGLDGTESSKNVYAYESSPGLQFLIIPKINYSFNYKYDFYAGVGLEAGVNNKDEDIFNTVINFGTSYNIDENYDIGIDYQYLNRENTEHKTMIVFIFKYWN